MGRYLDRNKGTEAPSNLLFFDTEALKPIPLFGSPGEKLKLRLWTAIALRLEKGEVTRRIVKRGHTPEEFWAFLDHRQAFNRPLWAFAHKLSHDLTQLHFWRELEKLRYTIGPIPRPPSPKTGKPRKPWLGRMCLESRPCFVVCRGKRGTVKFIDTGNYWPTKLAAIGAAFGLPKLAMPSWDATDEEWFQYCERDSEVCEVAVLDLIARWTREDCGTFKLTAPSMAMQHYKHTCRVLAKNGTRLNIVTEENHPYHALEREAYFGPRVEPFYVGTWHQQVHHLDCNSLYLAMMSAECFPRAHAYCPAPKTPKELLQRMAGLGACAKVLINARGNTYPVRVNGVQVHATGRFWTALAGPELKRALEADDVEIVHEAQCYSLERLFSGWADEWFERKLAAERRGEEGAGDAEFAKLIGLSLNGKWAQKGTYWSDTAEVACKRVWGPWVQCDYEEGTTRLFRGIGGHAQERIIDHEPKHCFPLISAYIASYAREYMRSVFGKLPPRSLLYSATDSLFVSNEGYQALCSAGLVDAERLGHFRHKASYRFCEVNGPNWYRLDFRSIVSGLHGKAFRSSDGTNRVKLWQQVASLIGSRPDGSILIQEVELKEHRATPKGIRQADGWVKPFWLTLDPAWSDRPPIKRLLH